MNLDEAISELDDVNKELRELKQTLNGYRVLCREQKTTIASLETKLTIAEERCDNLEADLERAYRQIESL